MQCRMSPAKHNTGSVKLYPDPTKVEKVIHLCAQNEYRHNFALNSVEPGHEDITLPGAHSDIGGGYLREDTEQRWLTRPRRTSGRASTVVENTHAWQRAEQDLAEWKQAHPWLADHPGIRLTSWRRRDSGPRSNHGYRIYVVAEFERTVRGELSLVYLRIMHKLAKQFGVPFEDVTPDLSELRLPTRLGSIYEKLDTQAQGGEAALTDEEWSLLHREYIHLSSHWAPIGISAAMKPAEGYSRIIHPHAPD